jgi:hypothetical protein
MAKWVVVAIECLMLMMAVGILWIAQWRLKRIEKQWRDYVRRKTW